MNFKDELNEKQYEAVASSNKYNRIIAGAGSGKTRVLTYRLAYLILNKHYEPYSLLAITFTNKAAREMKERTIKLLDGYDTNLKDMKISTFHSFCNYFLRKEIYLLGFPPSFSILDESDTKLLIKHIINDFGMEKGGQLLDYAIGFISNNKMKGIMPSEVKATNFNKLQEKSLEIYKEYEKRKNQQFSLDFDDLIIYTIWILKRFNEVKRKYNLRFKEILVDEFQDTNDLQFELLTLLLGEDTGVYVVGDPDQTIYTWRGANQKVMLDLEKYFPTLKTIILNENYRSTQNILDKANNLISFNKERIKKDLYTNNIRGEGVTLKKYYSDIDEAKNIVRDILSLEKVKGVKPNKIAILYRSSYLSRPLEKELLHNRMPYKIYGGLKFYDRKEVKDVLSYFQLLVNPYDDISFLRIYNIPRRGIGESSLAILRKEATFENLSLYNYCLKLKDDNYDSELSSKARKSLVSLTNFLEDYKVKINDANYSYSEVLDKMINDAGYYDYLNLTSEEDSGDRIANVTQLINDIRQFLKDNPESNLDEYLQNVSLLSSQDDVTNEEEIVSLMTVHTAKGLEFDYVFILGFNEYVFPNGRTISESGDKGIEEERRLAYVAFTRAKKELHLSYNEGYSYVTSSGGLPSRFIKEAKIAIPLDDKSSKFITKSNSPFKNEVYSINFGAIKNNNKSTTNNSNLDLDKKNDIKWSVGDKLNHKAFGIGEVIKVEGDLITVEFENFGIKKLLGSHHMITKL